MPVCVCVRARFCGLFVLNGSVFCLHNGVPRYVMQCNVRLYLRVQCKFGRVCHDADGRLHLAP